MKFLSLSTCLSSFTRASQRAKYNALARCQFAVARVVALLVLSSATLFAGGQTAHFDGAQVSVASVGLNILAIAVDAKGDVYFSVQNPFSQLASQSRRGVQYVPAAFHSRGTRHFSDGPNSVIAREMNASSCTYTGPGADLYVQMANSGTVSFLSGLNAPYGLALDSLGDLYVLDAYTGGIYEYAAQNGTVPLTGTPSFIATAQGDDCVGGDMAMDVHGNLYFTSPASNEVEEIAAVNGVIPPSPTSRSLGSGYDLPAGIAVDGSGNVYVASAENNAVEELLAVNGSIPASPTIRILGSGFSLPASVAVDSRGDVYVSDLNNNALKEILAVGGSIPSSPTIEVLDSLSQDEAVTLDASGDIFTGTGTGNVIELIPCGANFGQSNVGTAVPANSMAFTFDTAGALGGISVLTQGAAGLDFTNAGTGSCKANAAYSAGQTCTVNASFTPKFSGARDGAVVLTASNGSVIATGYLSGTGVGPQVNFLPGAQSTVLATGLSDPTGVAVDGSGNVYQVDTGNNRVVKETLSSGTYSESTVSSDLSVPYGVAVDGGGSIYIADTGNNRVLKETPTASGYSESMIASGVGFPSGIAVDAGGNVYITNDSNGLIVKETLSAGSYSPTTIVSGLSSPAGVAVDGSGNVYIADTDNRRVLKETLSGGTYTQTILPSDGLVAPTGITVDGAGNVYIVFESDFLVLKETLSAGSYTPSTLVSGLNSSIGPFGVTVDPSGNLYVGDEGNNQVLKEDFADPPSLSFASTAVGVASTDSPKSVTLENNGNAPLILPVPASGNNPSIGVDFSLNGSGQSDCPVLNSGSATAATLAPGATCELPVSFAPTVLGSLAKSLILTDNNFNAAAPNYSSQTIVLSGSGVPPAPAITWPTPAAITYGTALSTGQLDATASVAGTFSYSPAAGTVLAAGSQTITVTFTPNDTTDYSTATATVTLTVNQAAPAITWGAPAAVSYGTALGAAQLDATATVAGTFSYSPATGAVPAAGTQTLTAVFTPTDTVDYSTATATVALTVNQATPAITWSAPAAITYGTALGAAQLDATSTVAGTFSYSPAAGTALNAGAQTLTVTFAPTDTTDYTAATASVSLTVNQATPAITWGAPAAITYGTTLGLAQLDATSTVGGTFSYSPATGTALSAGSQTLTATFAPTDRTDYTAATSSVSLTVNQATPVINWAPPAAVSYGTALGAAQLDASSTIGGSFSYSPAAGTVLTAGSHTITATFTPTDTTDYTTATATVMLTVNQASPAITWGAPAAVTYGTTLGATQLDASATIAGSFSYSPAAGTALTAGSHTISATFTPTDTTDYTTATATVTLTVIQGTPTIAWSAPAATTYGTALGVAQLNATASVAGTFSYSPAAGTVLAVGTQKLTVSFTPTDTTDYTGAGANVSLTVNKAAPTVTWPVPSAIVYGTALSSTQLDATSTVAGSFAYSSAAGTVLGAGTRTLSVTFTPTNSTDYSVVTSTVLLTVSKATPTVTWPTPASINAGTPLSSTQLDASASVPGTFVYSPSAGTVLTAGNQTLTTTFTPTDQVDYNSASASVVLAVKAAPSFTLGASSGSLTVNPGKTGTDTIIVTGQNGFNSSVTLSASGLPSGVTVAYGANPTTGSSVLTFTASTSAAIGTYSITVKGISGSLSATTTISLTIQSAFACHVGYSITDSWSGGFEVALSLGNTGTTAISSWTLTWTFANGQKVTQFWNGNESQSGANVTVTNMSYNGTIAAGGSYTAAGFNGSWNNQTNAVPTSFAINGTVCK